MAKIEAPNKEYTGTVQGAGFVNGVAYVPGDAVNLDWFRRKGYKVSADERDSDAVRQQLRSEPEEGEEQAPSKPIEDASETAAWTDEMRRKEHGEGVGQLLPPGVGSPSSAPVIGPSQATAGGSVRKRQLDDKAAASPKRSRKSTRKKTSRRKSTARKSTRKSTRRKSTGGSQGSSES